MTDKYIISNPTSRSVSITADQTGQQTATIQQNGYGKFALGAQDAASVARAVAYGNIEPMRREAARLAARINERGTTVDKRTGQLPYVHPEETRRKDMLGLRQLSASIAAQEALAEEQAQQAAQAEGGRIAQMQAELAHAERVASRAVEIATEREAQDLAKRLTIKGGQVIR